MSTCAISRACSRPPRSWGRYEKNLRQVQRYEAELAEACDAHDRARETLAEACRAFFDRSIEDERIKGAVARAAGDSTATPYFIEYLINALDELPSYYELRGQWPAAAATVAGAFAG